VIGAPARARALARTLRGAALLAAAWVVATPAARACQACFGAEDSPIIDGAKAGAWMLIGLTFCMEAAFVGFFIYLRRRAKRASSIELDSEWRELQRNTRWS
jgi:hypothetical protein